VPRARKGCTRPNCSSPRRSAGRAVWPTQANIAPNNEHWRTLFGVVRRTNTTACQIRRDWPRTPPPMVGRARSAIGGKSTARNLAMPSVEHFRMALRAQLNRAQKRGLSHIDVKAGDLHRRLGGSPAYPHRIPSCCEAMYAEKRAGDVIITRPPEGKGASLTIRYKLPRKADA
jgi:5-methylcytosine-specific restriction protein A